jgi:hypothetical protein
MKNKRVDQRSSLCFFLSKKRRGWIRIVEAFVAILLVAGVLLIVVNKGYIGKEDISNKVYEAQIAVLREIELDNELRQQILGSPGNEEVVEVPNDVKIRIQNRIPDYLECVSKICRLDEICALEEYLEKDIYAQTVAIAATSQEYNPRQLKIFCWVK